MHDEGSPWLSLLMTAVSVDIHCHACCMSSLTLGSIILHVGDVVLLLLGGPAALDNNHNYYDVSLLK